VVATPNCVIGLARLHCYRAGIFQLIEVPTADARSTSRRLWSEGYVVSHIEYV